MEFPSRFKGQSELTSLVDRFIGPYYLNYETTRNILIRQGRDIFLCSYFGDVDKFRTGFCVPASNLMDEIFKKAKVKESEMSFSPEPPPDVGYSGGCLISNRPEHFPNGVLVRSGMVLTLWRLQGINSTN
ncbi:hypothetical protein M8J76_002945 [Diaphorina citri]|nr:hypothetical protein M8J76_002945 [Diaphorina citri]